MKEIDLHDKSVNEAIRYFIEKYNEILSNGFKEQINVIHGYGSTGVGGKIKKRFKEVSEVYKAHFKTIPGSNIGITIIKPLKMIPDENFLLQKSLLEFCSSSPKNLSKINNNFFKEYTNAEIKKVIHQLIKKDLLVQIVKSDICYQTKKS